MSSKLVTSALKAQAAWAKTAATAGGYWVFPGLLTLGWILFPALDQEWKESMGLATDPAAAVKKVQADKVARMEAHMKAKGITPPSAKPAAKPEEEEPEEEEEEEEMEEETPTEEEPEEESAPADEEEDTGDSEDDSSEEEDSEDEDSTPPPKPLYDPVKGKHLSPQDIWDNFTLKAVRMNDEDDDEEEEEDDDDDEDDDE